MTPPADEHPESRGLCVYYAEALAVAGPQQV